MRKIHESEPGTELQNANEDELFTPIKDLQRIEAGGVYKRKNLKLNTLPVGIRIIGYIIIGFTVFTAILGVILSFFNQ